MKSKMFFSLISITLITMILLSGCKPKDSQEDVVKTEFETAEFSEEFKKHIDVVIDENSIENDIATVKIVQPDLIKIFDEVIAEGASEQEEKLLSELKESLSKHTIEKNIETAVINIDGKWELNTSEDVDNVIRDSINEFLKHYLIQAKFNKIDWEDTP